MTLTNWLIPSNFFLSLDSSDLGVLFFAHLAPFSKEVSETLFGHFNDTLSDFGIVELEIKESRLDWAPSA